MVVVLADTNDMCIIRNPKTLKAKARFKTVVHKKCGKIRLVSRKEITGSKFSKTIRKPYQKQGK